MLKILKNRFDQGCGTSKYPNRKIELPKYYRGRPEVKKGAPADVVRKCMEACPQGAIDPSGKSIDMGRCVFCGNCERVSDGSFISFTRDFKISAADKKHLVTDGALPDLTKHSKQHFKKLFGRSLQLRQVSAGGCNACEADLDVLSTPYFDLERFGINFTASPRHADAIVVSGPVSRNMRTALLDTYEAMASPKAVIAVGACALSGGPFTGSPETGAGLDSLLPVDLFIPGCPPHPLTTLHALLAFFK